MPCKNHPSVDEPLVYCARCGQPFCPNCVVEIGGTTYCAACKAEALGDLRSGLPASGIDLATVGRRFGALFVDGLVIGLPLMLVFVVLLVATGAFRSLAASPGTPPDPTLFLALEGAVILLQFVVYILYEGLMLARGGQTLGKKAFHVKVVSAEGAPLSSGQAFGRAALRQVLGMVPCLGLINYLTAFGQDRTCIHDMMVRTRVVNW